MFAGPNFRAAIGVAVPMLLALWAAKQVWKIPAELSLLVAGMFVLWSVVFWGLPKAARPGTRQIGWFLSGFAALMAIVLGAVYWFDPSAGLWLAVTGYNTAFAEDLPGSRDRSLDEFARRYPWFARDPQDASVLVLRRGEYSLDETIVIPYGGALRIEPGAVLRLAPGRSLISYGPITARGTEQAPIQFLAQCRWRDWGTVGALNAGKCVFEYVYFQNGRYARVNGTEFLAGLSLIDCDAQIVHCRFRNMSGRDAANVQRGHVLIHGSLFQDIFKDGLDLDGGSGVVRNNRFVDCGDEGLDVSENRDIEVFDNEVLDSSGGRIGADVNLEEIKSRNVLGYSPAGGGVAGRKNVHGFRIGHSEEGDRRL